MSHNERCSRHERDQHLVVSVNDLSCEEWDRTCGAANRASIDAGAKTVMVGHILKPAYSRRLAPGIADRDIMPGSLSRELVLFYPVESAEGFAYSVQVGAAERFRQMLAAEGFDIDVFQPMGANVPVYVESLPTVFISVENPYHLLDVPRVKTYINAYASTDTVLEALVEKLMGRSPFKGTSPVDPFCGRWDTRL